MTNTMPFGVRRTNPKCIDHDYIVDSVALANETLEGDGKAFFFDDADVLMQKIGGRLCEDMYGWIVPTEDIEAFEKAWHDDDYAVLDQYEYATVEFRDGGDGKPVVSFDSEE